MNKHLLLFSLCGIVGIRLFSQSTDFVYTGTCFGNQTTLAASSSLPDSSIASWQWDLDGNGTYDMSGKIIISLFTLNDTNAVKLKIIPNVGNPDSVTKNVIINPLPQVNFFAYNLCESKPAIYISQSAIFPGSITQYKWDFNNDGVDDATGDSVSYICGPAQVYTPKLTCVSDKGCSAFTNKITTVYPNPAAAFSTSNACVNANAIFNNTTDTANINIDFYIWNFGDGNSNATSGNATHAYTSAGTYTVDLIAVTQQGCRDTTSSSVSINSLPIVSISGNTTACSGSEFFLTASGGTTYSWSDGGIGPTISTVVEGTYSVIATDNNGCSNTTSVTTINNPLPAVSIIGKDTLPAGGSIQLIANGADTYLWSTGETTPAITVTQSGTYFVRGIDLTGCLAVANKLIVDENPDLVSVSSLILTPNDDGINDYLVINNISLYINCDFKIYNIWNDEVFSISGYKNEWKGTNISGGELPAGAYYYIIQCDDKAVLKGNINILR